MATHGHGHNFQGVSVQGGRAHLGDIYQIVQEDPLDRLLFAHDAPFNSSGSNPDEETECLSGTRSGVLDRIHEWADGPSSASIFWLNGMAGTGKSTVARTIARAYYDKKQLGASFFFSRSASGPNKPAFFTTIAVQLASCCPSLRSAVTRAAENHNIANEKLSDQWNQLILNPLLSLDPESSSIPSPLVLVVDALDECESRHAADIIRLLSESKTITTVKLRILITSRPETAILRGFRKIPEATHENLALDEIPRHIVDGDISRFFRDRLSDIVLDSEDPPHDWPGEAAIVSLVQRSAGLFTFAATVCRLIEQNDCWCPAELLAIFVPSGQSDVPQAQKPELPSASPTAELDALYMTVLDKSMTGITSTKDEEGLARYFRLVVGSLVLLFEPLTITALANLLHEHRDTLHRRLCRLRSVLSVSADVNQPIRLLHPSFRDFFTSKDRCTDHKYQVDLATTHQLLTERCLGRLTRSNIGLKKGMCRLEFPGTLAKDAEAVSVARHIPLDMQYACVYWGHHLIVTGTPVADGDSTHQFLLQHFLHWLEALSLIKRFHDGITPLFSLDSVVLQANSPNMFEFVHDAKRFVGHGRSVMEEAPLQVYCGALLYSPENSVVRKRFLHQTPPWIKRLPAIEGYWNPCLQALQGHEHIVAALTFSPDGRIFASGSYDKTVKLWDPVTGSLNSTLPGHSKPVTAVAFSPTGQVFASASLDGTVKLWNPLDGTLHVTVWLAPSSKNAHVCFSPDGRVLVCTSDNTITLRDPMTGALHHSLNGHAEGITALSFSPDGKLLASGSQDCTVLLWDFTTGSIQRRLQHSAGLRDVAFSPVDGNVLATACGYGTVNLWDADRGLIKEQAPKHNGSRVVAVELSPDGAYVAILHDGKLRLWNLKSGTLAALGPGGFNLRNIGVVAFSPDGKLLASTSRDNLVRLWDPVASIAVADHLGRDRHFGQVNTVAVSTSGRMVASASQDQSVKLWDPETGTCLATLVGHKSGVQAVAFSPDEQNLASTSSDGMMIVWDMATSSIHRLSSLPHRWVSTNIISFSPNGRVLVASGSMLGPSEVCLWDTATGMILHTLRRPSASARAFAFSPDPRLVAAVFHGHSSHVVESAHIRVWDVRTGQKMIDLSHERSTEPVRWLYFDPAGTHLRTNQGSVELPRPVEFETTDYTTPPPAAIYARGNWINYEGRGILRPPSDYDLHASDFQAGILALGHKSGRVSILHLDENAIPRSSKFR